jgi:predicted DNA-binding protein
MTVAVRLPEELEADLRRLATRTGHTLSDCVREACVAYIAQQQPAAQAADANESEAYRIGKHVFGCADSGDATRWKNRKQIIATSLTAKHRARSPRAH